MKSLAFTSIVCGVALWLALFRGGAAAAVDSSGTASETSNEFTFFPALFYLPETGVGGGAGLVVILRGTRTEERERPQTVSATCLYTAKNQVITALSSELYLAREAWLLRGTTTYNKFPSALYGVGLAAAEQAREEYTSEDAAVQVSVLRRLCCHLRAGGGYGIQSSHILKRKPGGLLALRQVAGSRGGVRAGLSAVIEWDSRDHVYYPTAGSWYMLKTTLYRAALGSDFRFSSQQLDLRRYVGLGGRHVLALQGYAGRLEGDVPFLDYWKMGDIMRGVNAERFIDRVLTVARAEYRFPVWQRVRGAVFTAAGGLAHDEEGLRLADVQHTFGAGLRYALNEREQIHVRIDLGVGPEGTEVYFQFMEAF